MKRFLCILISALLFAGLIACGDTTPPDLTFTNGLSTVVHNVYVSPAEQEDWNDPVSISKISSGSTIEFDFSKIEEGAGPGIYDLGAIDENAMNYDAYEVPLAVGDKIDLSGSSDSAVYTITHADGATDSYDAYIYPNE